MRALGIDLGTKRIGLAVSDISGTIASPHSVLLRAKSVRLDHLKIAEIVLQEEVEVVVIGPAAKAATTEARQLSTVLSVPVEMFDERMTTVAADRALKEANLSASARRQYVDKVAAAIMLQAWLESRHLRE